VNSPRPRPPRGPARFRAADVKRAFLGAQAAKIPVAAVRIEPDGSILVIPGTPEAVPASTPNEWD
jgi:hypothetical protein